MRFVIYGAGAVGGVLGARLVEAGHDVTLIARGEHLAVMRRDGLTVATPAGTTTLPVPAVGSPAEAGLEAGDAVVVLTMKTHDTADAVGALAVCAPADTPVVCAQNGVENERIALRSFARVYGVPVLMPATHLEPGRVEAQSTPVTGVLDVGRYPSGLDDTARDVADAFAGATFSSVARPDIMRWKYRKLILNLGNAAEAITGSRAAAAALDARAADEGEAVLRAAGIDHASSAEDVERRGDLLRMRPIDGRRRLGGSSWQSLARGVGRIESDHLNGEIALLGRLHGVPTPVNDLLQRVANRCAAEGLAPGSMTAEEVEAELAGA